MVIKPLVLSFASRKQSCSHSRAVADVVRTPWPLGRSACLTPGSMENVPVSDQALDGLVDDDDDGAPDSVGADAAGIPP